MKSTKKEAVIQLVNGQRRYGSIIGNPAGGNIHFLSFLNEQLFGLENFQPYVELIDEKQINEIDFLLK